MIAARHQNVPALLGIAAYPAADIPARALRAAEYHQRLGAGVDEADVEDEGYQVRIEDDGLQPQVGDDEDPGGEEREQTEERDATALATLPPSSNDVLGAVVMLAGMWFEIRCAVAMQGGCRCRY